MSAHLPFCRAGVLMIALLTCIGIADSVLPHPSDRTTRSIPAKDSVAPSDQNSHSIHADNSAPRYNSDDLSATNRVHGLRATIRKNGMVCSPIAADSSSWSVSILLDRIGRGADWSEPNVDATTQRTKEHMISKHGAFDLEHVNNEAGIRQNFIVHRKPSGEGPLRVELRTESDLVLTHAGADVFLFADSAGIARLRYSDLHVWDANGDTLPASAHLEDGLIVLEVEDELAAYPITVDPLLTTAVWTMDGDQSNGEFGWSVSTAGDVNGDGYSDIIIGHHLYDNGETNEGRAVVYYGSASGPSVTASWTIESNSAGAQMGYSVATAGDVNGDGYSDIIIGAPYLSNGNALEGRASVYHGGPTGLPASPSWTFESGQDNAYLGRSVACAGDVNGDGYSDVIVGAPLFDNGQVDEGRVLVFHGSPAGLAATPTWTTESNQDGATAGASVAGAGDVNGDGFSDVIYGAPFYDNGQTNEGRAVLHLGSTTGLHATIAWSSESNQAGANTGASVASAGDVNNDGYSDVVVGVPLWDNGSTDEGMILIARGVPGGLTLTNSFESNSTNDQRGTSVACAGDVNGDGYADIIAGSAQIGGNGVASIFIGGLANTNTPSPLLAGAQLSARFGRSVASAGDVNGDGFSDVLVGAYFHDNPLTNEGQAHCFLGAPASINNAAPFTRSGVGAFGRSVSSAGDVNGDGYSDIIIGEPQNRTAHVYHGSPTGPSATPVRTYNEPGITGFGYCVSTAGDVNGDGYSDVIVGSDVAGLVRVYHGSGGGLPAVASWTASSVPAANFGFSVSSAGDVNGDGYSDVIIGHPGYNGAGRVVVYHGSPTGLGASPVWQYAPALAGSLLGEGVDGIGDVNGDGYSDVIIGAGGYNTARGRVVIFHGGAAGLGALPAYVNDFAGAAGSRFGSNPHSGACVGGAGDVNGDGYSDVIMAWMGGQAFVHHGGPAGISVAPSWSSTNYGGGSYFAASVASAGDINADGYSDVVISNCGQGAMLYYGGPTGLVGPDEDHIYPGSGTHSASGAGDVNGDGYSDVLIGQYTFNQAHVFFGNAFSNWTRGNFRLYETDLTTPIRATNIPNSLFGAGLFSRPFLGRSKTRLVWETRIQGQAFSTGSNGSTNNSTAFTAQQPALVAGAVAGVELKSLVAKPGGGTGLTATKIRARVRYDPVTALTGQVFGPWRYMPGYLDGHGTHNNVPLPVELLHFDAQCVNGSVELSWATGSEENSSHFVVQRSEDGEHWSDVARQTAAGHSHSMVEYDYSDKVPPRASTLYYRLLQVDLDGSTTTLPTTVVVLCEQGGGMIVYPNPAGDHAVVRLAAELAERGVWLVVMDAMGKSALQQALTEDSNEQTLALGSLPSGTYLISLQDKDGSSLSETRLVIDH